jgi:CO dehydrogenase/acetyl-CoA synthase beta subunit
MEPLASSISSGDPIEIRHQSRNAGKSRAYERKHPVCQKREREREAEKERERERERQRERAKDHQQRPIKSQATADVARDLTTTRPSFAISLRNWSVEIPLCWKNTKFP